MTVINMDCRAGMAALAENSVDAIVTDPPYGLSKQPNIREVLKHWLAGDDYEATGGGFMGKKWDSFVPGPLTWEAAFRALKPGGYIACFAGSRTVDLMSTSLRLGGFEVVDMCHWLYGSGFPKSMDISKAIEAHKSKNSGVWEVHGGSYGLSEWEGWGTALKPAHEPIIIARKPLDGTYANNILAHGVGGLNIDACRNGERWPGNVMHDGCLPDPMDKYFYCAKASSADREAGLKLMKLQTTASVTERDADSVGHNNPRAGTRGADRANIHPTVKPTELMRWLCRLITPPGGTVLDPFTGSGSTGRGAVLEGFTFIGFELSEEYAAIAQARINEARK